MTPTLAQRLWLTPVSLPPAERRRLVSARAAFILFVVQPTLGLAAAATTSTIDGVVLGATAVSYGLAMLILGFYERLPALVKALAATAGALVISSFVYSQPGGEVFVLLYVGLVFYVSFFSAVAAQPSRSRSSSSSQPQARSLPAASRRSRGSPS